ncbi:acyl-CoA dehydrogenase family protein [Duganella sp. sic0402]|uniref:acyl-CoA dehydrogenase family protein n=1 Tax=Duganella sp. sic0402 TaxID=2854786 RepID=UPI001C4647AE|nr:acyl-CoA dehydrogenase family protein [Duganella sp. sic0402]MBV7534891.1 acyl-CoA dehydrogenase family protein [Duganella sp. sic0402]
MKIDRLPYASAHSLSEALARLEPQQSPARQLAQLIDAGQDQLPLPARGATLQRWQCLALAAHHDLSLAKLYEGHTDALAILDELQGPSRPGAAWGVWCAESRDAGLVLRQSAEGQIVLAGRKQWCSGAAALSHALVSCTNANGERQLAAVALRDPGVTITSDGWHAVGMAATASVDVVFDDVPAIAVGAPGAYLNRPGFWYGGAGIAACWFGAAQALAGYLHAATRGQVPAEPHRLAHLGQVEIALSSAAALMRDTARALDQAPGAYAGRKAMRLRLAVEDAATKVLHHVTRALGAGPICRDARFAQLAADLPVFLRQSHAERDLAALGELVAQQEHAPWTL